MEATTKRLLIQTTAAIGATISWSAFCGVLLGLAFRFGSGAVGTFALDVFHEQIVPKSIDLLIAIGATVLCIHVAVLGRLREPGYLRRAICLGAIQAAANFAAIIFALGAGMAVVNLPDFGARKLLALAVFALIAYVGGLVLLLVGSHRGTFTDDERIPRSAAVLLALTALPLFCWAYLVKAA